MAGQIFELAITALIVIGGVYVFRSFGRMRAESGAEWRRDAERRPWFEARGWRYESSELRRTFRWQAGGHTDDLGELRVDFEFRRHTHSNEHPRVNAHAPAPPRQPAVALCVHEDELARLRGPGVRMLEAVGGRIADADVAAEDGAFRRLLDTGVEARAEGLPGFVWLAAADDDARRLAGDASINGALASLLDSLPDYFADQSWKARSLKLRCSPEGGYRFEAVTPSFDVAQAGQLLVLLAAFAATR